MFFQTMRNREIWELAGKLPTWIVLVLYYNFAGFSPRGYVEKWFSYRFFGMRVVFRNADDRAKHLRGHDLHHVTSGLWDTSWLVGESLIGWFELGAGCWKHAKGGSFFNAANAFIGFLLKSDVRKNAFREFVRGRRAESFYQDPPLDLAALMEQPLEDVRRKMAVPPAYKIFKPGKGDRGAFVRILIAGFFAAIGLLLMTVVGLIVSFVFWIARKKLDFSEEHPVLREFTPQARHRIMVIRSIVKGGRPLEKSLRRELHALLEELNQGPLPAYPEGLDPILFPPKDKE